MAPSSDCLRRFWGHGLLNTYSMPASIAQLDGSSDDLARVQQTYGANLLQQQKSALAKESVEPLHESRQNQAAMCRGAQLSGQMRGQDQPTQRLAGNEYELEPNHTHDLGQTRQESCTSARSQNSDTLRPLTTAQHLEPHASRSQLNRRTRHSQSPDAAAIVDKEAYSKQILAVQEYNDQDPFSEFTNQDFYYGDSGVTSEAQQEPKASKGSIDLAPFKVCSMKPESATEARLPISSLEEDPLVEPATDNSTISNIQGNVMRISAQDSHDRLTQAHSSTHENRQYAVANITSAQYLAENLMPDPQQPAVNSPRSAAIEKNRRSPSVDSVITPDTHSSVAAVPSLSRMDLDANSHFLAQQWQQRHDLLDMDTNILKAEAVQAEPVLLHSPASIQQQYERSSCPVATDHPARTQVNPSSTNALSLDYTHNMNGRQHTLNVRKSSNTQYPTYPLSLTNGQLHPGWMQPGFSFNASTSHLSNCSPSVPSRPPGSQRVVEVKEEEEEGPEASDDDKPLATRVPRHQSTTSSPIGPHPPATPRTNMSGPKPSSALLASDFQEKPIDISDENNGEVPEPICWKLPDFEATFHPPATNNDMPMAKISTLGQTQNLVRAEVLLNEDHSEQEMQLFIEVFLPAQKALEDPDPEPAHAVLNFHTISVMVLEAFVQWEIGDEQGRGGSGLPSNNSNSSGAATEVPTRTRSALDADVDEIFFAVVDRWRAGTLSGKESFKLIRGCQEFCDVALDVIHYVKQHGLLQPPVKKRKERCDKGTVRGPRGTAGGEDAGKEKGVKRKAQVVEKGGPKKAKNGTGAGGATLQVRKKAKESPKAKPKAKGTTSGGVSVIKK